MSNQANGAVLIAFVEQVEQLETEKQEIADLIKEKYAEIKAQGYDTTVIRKIIRERKADPDKLAEMEVVEYLYKSVLGME